MIAGLAIAAVVAVGAWLLFLRPHGVGDALSDERSRESIARDVEAGENEGRGQRNVLLGFSESDLEAGLALGGVGGAVAGAAFGTGFGGPIGAFIGFTIGVFAAEVAAAIAHESYGRIVRDALQKWLRSEGYAGSAANVDALLYREALLTADYLYQQAGTGLVAAQWIIRQGVGQLTLFGSVASLARANIPGMAASQAHQMIARCAPGQLDGDGQRANFRAWKARAFEGALYVIGTIAATERWRTPGYVYFTNEHWPRVADNPTPLTREWTRIVPSAENVDALAAWYDRRVGADWTKS